MEIYERNFNIKVSKLDEGLIGVKSSMLDLDHNIFIELVVDVDSREIKRATSEMVKVPHDDKCRMALRNIDRVQGLKLEQGLAKSVSSALGSSTGCTHLVEIFMLAARAASNVIIGLKAGVQDWEEIDLEAEEFRHTIKPYLENTCIVFRK